MSMLRRAVRLSVVVSLPDNLSMQQTHTGWYLLSTRPAMLGFVVFLWGWVWPFREPVRFGGRQYRLCAGCAFQWERCNGQF